MYEEYRAKLIKIQFQIPHLFQPDEYVHLTFDRDKAMNAFIKKEIELYNNLIAKIHENLDETLAAIDGIKNSNERTDNTFECLQYERTPTEWLKNSYPAHKSLPTFIINLKTRVMFIHKLLKEA